MTFAKKIITFFLLLVGYFTAQAQDNVRLIQQKKQELQQFKNLHKEVEQLLIINQLYHNLLTEKHDAAQMLYDKAKLVSNSNAMAIALLSKGWCENYKGEYANAEKSLNEAAQLFLRNNDSLNYFLTLSEWSITKRRTLLYSEAENNAYKSYEYFLINKTQQHLSLASYNLASVYMDLDQYDKGLLYGQQALKYAQQQNNAHDLGFAYMILGRVKDKLNDDAAAEKNYLLAEKALASTTYCIARGINYFYLLQFYNKTKQFQKSLHYLNLITENDICMDQPIQVRTMNRTWMQTIIYEKAGDYPKTIQYAEEYLSIGDSSFTYKTKYNNYELKGLPRVLIPYSRALFKTGEIEKAKKNILYAFEISKRSYRKSEIIEESELLSSIYQTLNDYKKSLEYEKIKFLYHDSLTQENRIKEIDRLQTAFDTENLKKEKNLLAQENAVKSLEISRGKIIFITISALLLVLFVVIYLFLQRKKLKTERDKIAIEQRFLISQLNPHFIFNSLSSIQQYIINNNALDAGSYLAKFSKLMRNILENSREEYVSLENELSTVKYYLELQQLRFNNSFTYSIQLSADIDSESIQLPPMFVQPFLENSIEHGFSGVSKKWNIDISISLIEQDYVQIVIVDNGIGRKKSEENKVNGQHKSLATKITNERIDFLRKQNKPLTNITISDAEGNGTKVTLSLPSFENN
ncbi:MAG: histidine kinase [Bacteroidetes bacterium]|nr:histidine kinase [Bacteroidota bacterium]